MPRRALKKCHDMHCPNLTTQTYCEHHAHLKEEKRQAQHRQYKQDRQDEKEQRFYSSTAWLKLRDTKRTRSPLCEHCEARGKLTPMQEVDHIVEVKDNWALRLTYSNLQSPVSYTHLTLPTNREV